MAITKFSDSDFINKKKYTSFLAGNTFFDTSMYESIATLTGSSVASYTFSSIPTTYKHLQIRFVAKSTINQNANDLTLAITFNGSTSTIYGTHGLRTFDSSTTVSGYGFYGAPRIFCSGVPQSHTNQTSVYGAGIIDILDYNSTTKNKTLKAFSGSNWNTTATGAQVLQISSGIWASTSAITSITLAPDAAYNFDSNTKFALYGIKG